MVPQSKKSRRGGDLDRPWHPGDSIPAPEALQADSDVAWALWNEAERQQAMRFADTAPLTRPPDMTPEQAAWAQTVPGPSRALAPSAPAAPAPQPVFTLESAMLVARRNNRVCPRPERWAEFMALLPPRRTLRGYAHPPVPPSGAAWAVTAPLTKRLYFREHIEWAQRAGTLEAAMEFMHSLAEHEWLHMGED